MSLAGVWGHIGFLRSRCGCIVLGVSGNGGLRFVVFFLLGGVFGALAYTSGFVISQVHRAENDRKA